MLLPFLFPPGYLKYEGDVSHMLHDSGDYIFRVYLYANEEDYLNDKVAVISDDSDVFHYVKPEQKIEAPKNVRWDSANPGTVVWDSLIVRTIK